MRIFCVLLASSVVFGQSAAPDLVIHHAKIFTGIAGRPFATAIAVRGDRIAAIGTDDAVLATAEASTRRIDGEGRVVIPGLNNAHTHINPQPPVTAVPLHGQEPAWEEVQSALTDALATSGPAPC
jgi:predicted amidohydrolase YtcJ